MALIKSISGIRGTIGGEPGKGLTPLDVVKFTAAFGSWLKKQAKKERIALIVGRDARISGEMVNRLVSGTLLGLGIDVVDIGPATTPTTEIAVTEEQADGGIILTASHNPKQWNALKLLNGKGEFINDKEGKEVLTIAENEDFDFVEVDLLGTMYHNNTFTEKHIRRILDLSLVDKQAVTDAEFTVVIDGVNSVGGISIPPLLKALGVKNVIELYCEPNGKFPHNPEPLPENLTALSGAVRENKADVGFVVDPDVDRLAIVNEDGSMFGEEYSLVAVADYVLQHTKGNTASNLSSTKALGEITRKHGGEYHASAVGEVNVVAAMKENNAVIGGEGNGGVIYPEIHYGRDALVGIALFLTYLAKTGKKCSELRAGYPTYHIAKNKIQIGESDKPDEILANIEKKYTNRNDVSVLTIDGVKLEFNDAWVSLRKSNTEPIIRIYTEADTKEKAEALTEKIMKDIKA